MGTIRTITGIQPICSLCMIALCCEISETEYEERKDFWEDWECHYCNQNYLREYTRRKMNNKMVKPTSWEEFRESGLLLYVNMILHAFGWSLVVEIDEEQIIKKVYPARVAYRGFSNDATNKAYSALSLHLKDYSDELSRDGTLADEKVALDDFGAPVSYNAVLKKGLRDLVDKWVNDADPDGEISFPDDYTRGLHRALLNCSNELRRVIFKQWK